jgi:nitrite reductase/ring-hydroxylating ferredoxin subunit
MTALGEGQMTACTVAGQELLIANVEGQYYAVSNICSHGGQRLSAGRLRGFELRCPLHRATFDIRTGAALSAPAREGLRSFPVLLSGGKVNVAVQD